ncbi:MAG: Endoribonuclease YbeY [Beijerinckiaceae bacterium]|jgi:probable rRNA maturation factor|nr:MAG: Endoribonuclease YbeY [Beijerinckiaceae bacterium]
MNPVIEVAIEAKDWASLEAPSKLVQTAILAAVEGSGLVLAANTEISVVLCGNALIRELNREWRGYDAPTNVLSFPAGGDPASAPLLGDIVIAFETASREAFEAGKPLRDHVAHLLVHGFLHLIGHDHVEAAEAEAMEALERAILGRLGIDDPYRASLIEEAAGAHE